MIDTHAHLTDLQLLPRLNEILTQFKANGGHYIINIATTYQNSLISLDLSQKYLNIYTSIGLHPEILIPESPEFIDNFDINTTILDIKHLIQETKIKKIGKIVAIGECGIDLYWPKKMNLPASQINDILKKQINLFEKQIQLAIHFKLPLVIHIRDINDDSINIALDLVRYYKAKYNNLTGVFHSYTGNLQYVSQIISLGFYVSFNGIITYKNADNVREILKLIPQKRLLLETDSPYLIPTKAKGKIKFMEPTYIDFTADFVAKLLKIDKKELWQRVEHNAKKLFGIKGKK